MMDLIAFVNQRLAQYPNDKSVLVGHNKMPGSTIIAC